MTTMLTKEEIDLLESSKLDDHIAQTVLGWKLEKVNEQTDRWIGEGAPNDYDFITAVYVITPRFSTFLEEAWKVVEYMRKAGLTLVLCSWADGTSNQAFFSPDPNYLFQEIESGYGPTPALAICRAALKDKLYRPTHLVQPQPQLSPPTL